jgi:hypothetical protein
MAGEYYMDALTCAISMPKIWQTAACASGCHRPTIYLGRLRLNPRKSWWNNIAEIAADSPAEATFVLKRPQPAILALIGSGYTPVYPCHVSPRNRLSACVANSSELRFCSGTPHQRLPLVDAESADQTLSVTREGDIDGQPDVGLG